VPFAVNCVDEFTVVARPLPFSRTFAPLTKFVPITTNVKAPVFAAAGLMPVIVGVGFISVTALLALFVVSAALVAVTVTEFGFGKVDGAEYFPFASIVPTAADPPFMPLTAHVTLGLLAPLTLA